MLPVGVTLSLPCRNSALHGERPGPLCILCRNRDRPQTLPSTPISAALPCPVPLSFPLGLSRLVPLRHLHFSLSNDLVRLNHDQSSLSCRSTACAPPERCATGRPTGSGLLALLSMLGAEPHTTAERSQTDKLRLS